MTLTTVNVLLNIADLMATKETILPIYDHLQDIASRRKIDHTNILFFFTSLINILNAYLNLSSIGEDYEPV